ncbi:MAG: STAS domain-containing protein [Treponema sp.]|nr:STAS domain-containing protein [Treponema sp.]
MKIDDDLEINQEIKDGICKITAKGRIDSNNADFLLEKLLEIIKEGQKVIILNMAQIEYLSSIGIRVVLKLYKQAMDDGGSFKIESPSKIVKNVLGMVALQEMLVAN